MPLYSNSRIAVFPGAALNRPSTLGPLPLASGLGLCPVPCDLWFVA